MRPDFPSPTNPTFTYKQIYFGLIAEFLCPKNIHFIATPAIIFPFAGIKKQEKEHKKTKNTF